MSFLPRVLLWGFGTSISDLSSRFPKSSFQAFFCEFDKIPLVPKSTRVSKTFSNLGSLLAITFTALGEVLVPRQDIFLVEISL